MTSPELLSELRDLLEHGTQVSDRLLERLDANPDPVEIVNLLESLALTDERRAHVLDQLRRDASRLRKREEERSVRQFVLRALDRIGVPQTTGFLEDYLYATELVEAKSRGMGALRRDEYRAWDRLRDKPRLAYIVPCLGDDGRPVSRWMARSDWPLASRMVVDGAEELWSLERVGALWKAYGDADRDTSALFVPVIERYAAGALGVESPVAPSDVDSRLADLVGTIEQRTSALRPLVESAQGHVAERLAVWDEPQRFWGLGGRAHR